MITTLAFIAGLATAYVYRKLIAAWKEDTAMRNRAASWPRAKH